MIKLIKKIFFLLMPYSFIFFISRIIARYRHKNLTVEKETFIPLNLKLGENIHIYENVKISNSEVGSFTYIASNTIINKAQIGRFCSIASNVKIGLGEHPSNIFVSTSPIFYSKKNQLGTVWSDKDYFQENKQTIIGNDVWIGTNAIIRDGVKIGDGAIIGAGAVVVKDVDSYSIVGGVPAKLIRFRFTENEIKNLLEDKWWDKDTNFLKQNFKSFHNVKEYLNIKIKP